MAVASGAAAAFPVGFGYYPPEGSRVVSAQYNFATQLAFAEDLSQLVARGVETSIQSAYIDNSANSFNVTLTIGGTLQVLNIPPFACGIFPVFFTGTPAFSIVSAGNVNNAVLGTAALTRVLLLNVPASPDLWNAATVIDGGQQTIIGQQASFQAKVGAGRLAKIIVNTAIAVGSVAFCDFASTGTTNQGNTVHTLASGTTAGTVVTLDWPVKNGIAINFNGGATGVVSVSFS
jgi:hypothetical protein